MKAIVAVDENWAIGRDGDMLLHLSDDLKYFKRNTMGKVVVMGRTTLESLPGGRPLPDRTNIVLTSRQELKADVIICASVEELRTLLTQYDNDAVYIIGGGQVYRQLVPLCDEALITKIKGSYDADTYFPNLDADPDWQLVSESGKNIEKGIEYTWCVYRRI